jgi:hypothetical protein
VIGRAAISAAVLASWPAFRPVMITVSPPARNRAATALPSPFPPPVTSTIRLTIAPLPDIFSPKRSEGDECRKSELSAGEISTRAPKRSLIGLIDRLHYGPQELGPCQIGLFCAPQWMNTESPAVAPNGLGERSP